MNSISLSKKEQLRNINSYILMLIAFFIPLSIAIPSLLTAVIIIIWLVIGDFKQDWAQLKNNQVVIAVLVFFAISTVGLLWSSSLEYGLTYTLKKESRFLLIPLFMLFMKKEHIKYYLYGFLLAITISEISSYAIFFEIIEPFKKATLSDPTPFLGHITYNPILAIAIYIILFYLLFSDGTSKKQKILYTLFAITMSINMFITGGRAGQVMYFAMIIIVIFQFFDKQRVKAIILSVVLLPTLLFTFYSTSTIFQTRVDNAVKAISNFEDNKQTPLGLRINWAINSWEIIKENPILGVGTGSFRGEFDKVNQRVSPDVKTTINPHNMYVFQLVELGLLGLLALLSLFFFQIKQALKIEDRFQKYMGIALPLLFMLIMLSESYLLVPSTAFLFAFMSALLYKEYK